MAKPKGKGTSLRRKKVNMSDVDGSHMALIIFCRRHCQRQNGNQSYGSWSRIFVSSFLKPGDILKYISDVLEFTFIPVYFNKRHAPLFLSSPQSPKNKIKGTDSLLHQGIFSIVERGAIREPAKAPCTKHILVQERICALICSLIFLFFS